MDRDDHSSPSDIITYIGVPLAVLGVLPILYNTVVTLAALSKIKRMLRHSQLKALLRGDVVNRVIEVELPRYAVTPLDRFEHRREYWSLSRCPSSIPGGSWTTFNWRTNVIGNKTQRVEYADQLRQPQVEVAFGELVSYLMDLGEFWASLLLSLLLHREISAGFLPREGGGRPEETHLLLTRSCREKTRRRAGSSGLEAVEDDGAVGACRVCADEVARRPPQGTHRRAAGRFRREPLLGSELV